MTPNLFPGAGKKPRQGRWPTIPPSLEALVDPRLHGALCVGQAPAFDDQIDGESDAERHSRLTAAASICHRCPVREACGEAATEHKAAGLWAGRLRNPAGSPGRPRKDEIA